MVRVAPDASPGLAWGASADLGQDYGRGGGSASSAGSAAPQQTESGCLPCGNCCVAVAQDKWFAVEKFGKFDRILSPGLSFAGCDLFGMCIGFRSITSRVEQNMCRVTTKTKDNVFVTAGVAVQQVVKPDSVENALYRLTDVNAQIESYVSDVVRSQVPVMTLDEAFERKDDLGNAIQEKLCKEMASYGFTILKALVVDLTPDASVMHSMNEINKQKRLRDASIMVAEGDKIRVVKHAEAAADAAQLQGEGVARQRRAIVEGLRDSIQSGTGEILSADRVGELMLITQYFETLKLITASGRAETVFLPMEGRARGGGGVASSAAPREVCSTEGAPGQVHM